MKVFHYAKLDSWNGIVEGSYKSDHRPGLGAVQNLTKNLPTRAVFGLLEPLPPEWVNNQDFQNIWRALRLKMGTMLLEIDVDSKTDPVYVIDNAHISGFLLRNEERIPSRYLHTTLHEAETEYVDSMLPIEEFLERKAELCYSLPEVIITDNIPFEKISVSEQQPLLEDSLKTRGRLGELLREQVMHIPELQPWYRNYQETQSNSEGTPRRLT